MIETMLAELKDYIELSPKGLLVDDGLLIYFTPEQLGCLIAYVSDNIKFHIDGTEEIDYVAAVEVFRQDQARKPAGKD